MLKLSPQVKRYRVLTLEASCQVNNASVCTQGKMPKLPKLLAPDTCQSDDDPTIKQKTKLASTHLCSMQQ